MSGKSEKNMTLSGHLRELRNRVVVCIVCLVVSFLAGLNYSEEIVNMLTDMGTAYGYSYVFISPQELLLQYFSVAMLAAVCITLPVILYQIWAFVQPGLKKNENMLFLSALFFGLICFVTGVIFAYKIMLPFMLRFLIGLSAGSDITAAVSVQNYIGFLLTIFMIMGVVFELPVIAVILTQLGLVKVSWMRKGRKVVIILIFLIAALITPPDIVSQIMVAFPMIGLYELSIVICAFLQKLRRKKRDEEAADEE